MINPSELRVGNFVDTVTAYPDYIIVAGIYKGHVCFHDGDMFLPKYVEPLDLTPEWLERFGFDNNKDHEGYYMSGGWICKNYSEGDGGVHCIAEVRYVHQLQNLYFALTGQELELKTEAVKS